MARTNKYSSINFNEIYDKKFNPNKSSAATSSSTKSSLQNLSNSRIHGGMLVLTRPTPKPLPQPQIIPQQQPSLSTVTQIPKVSDQPNIIGQDSISLRPGSTSITTSQPITIATHNREKESLSSSSSRSPSFSSSSLSSPKPEPFVPPHLRPGFVGKHERLVQEGQTTNQGFRSRELGENQGRSVGSPNQYGDNGRPKSGGYHRAGDSDQELMNRPSSSSSSGNLNRPNSSGSRSNSSGNRPNSSGWYGSSSSSYRSPHHY